MGAVSTDLWAWSSTAASNNPLGSDAIGASLDDTLRNIQAAVRGALEQATSVTGTNTITASMAGLAAYASGMLVRFIPANSNTGATTININSIGAKNIYLNGAALIGYELRKNCPVQLHYDGTQFNIVAGAHGGDGIPIGQESNRYFSTAPNGHLLCDGSAVSRATYPDLFSVISTTYGVGDGSTTFNLPNAARRVSVGSGGTGTSTLANTVGSTGGAETHTLTTAEMPAHVHTIQHATDGAGGSHFLSGGGSNNTTVDTLSTGGGGAHNNLPPSMVVYKCIKY